jgi:uncharacterized protein YbjT (DUF2867 family)
VAGATGLVGRSLVSLLARDPQVPWIRLPLRRTPERAFDAPHGAKLRPTIVDFAHLDRNAALFEVDQVFVCLGTTIKDAGSREAFRRVDFEYVLSVAELGAAGGARDLLVVTALGADPESRVFYNRVKGEVEAQAGSLPYRSISFFRPSLLLGARSSSRPAERLGAAVGGLLTPLLRGRLARYRPVQGAEVAAAMAEVARAPGSGVRVIESDEIVRLARGR